MELTVRLMWVCGLLSLPGCGTYQGTGGIPGSPLDRLPMAVLNIPARQAVAAVSADISEPPLSLTVESAEGGVIVTGWKDYPGTLHIVRRWPERSRFFIVINPDFNDPEHKCRVLVYDQTQEKGDDRQGFVDNPQLYRRDRADEILRVIQQHTASPAVTSK